MGLSVDQEIELLQLKKKKALSEQSQDAAQESSPWATVAQGMIANAGQGAATPSAPLEGAKMIGTVAGKGFQAWDKYLSVPTRNVINNPSIVKGIWDKEKRKEYDPKLTGKQVAENYGASTEPIATVALSPLRMGNPTATYTETPGMQIKTELPSPAGVGGVVIDSIDPLMLYGTSKAIATPAFKLGKEVLKLRSLQAANLGMKVVPELAEKIVPGAGLLKGTIEESFAKQRGIVHAGRGVRGLKDTEFFTEIAEPVAKRYGIDPDDFSFDLRFGREKDISKLERGLKQSPLAEVELDKHNRVFAKLTDAVDSKLDQLGVVNTNPTEAGEMIVDAYQASKNRLFENIDTTYRGALTDYNLKVSEQLGPKAAQSLVMQVPDDARNSLFKSLYKIRDSLSRGTKQLPPVLTSQGELQRDQSLKHINGLIEFLQDNTQYSALLDTMQEYGKAAYGAIKSVGSTDIPLDIQTYRDMYTALSRAALDSVQAAHGVEYRKSLEKANEAISTFLTNSKPIEDVISKNTDSKGRVVYEAIYNKLMKNGNSVQLKSLAQTLSPEEKNRLGAAFIAINKKTTDVQVRDRTHQLISFAQLDQLFTKWEKRRVLDALLDPDSLKELEQITMVGQKHGIPIANPSGTGPYLVGDKALSDLPKHKEDYERRVVEIQKLMNIRTGGK